MPIFKTKRLFENGRLVKTVGWTQRGAPSQRTPDEEEWGEPGKTLYYYDEKGRRVARVTYGDVESEPPETPLGVTRYYYDCA